MPVLMFDKEGMKLHMDFYYYNSDFNAGKQSIFNFYTGNNYKNFYPLIVEKRDGGWWCLALPEMMQDIRKKSAIENTVEISCNSYCEVHKDSTILILDLAQSRFPVIYDITTQGMTERYSRFISHKHDKYVFGFTVNEKNERRPFLANDDSAKNIALMVAINESTKLLKTNKISKFASRLVYLLSNLGVDDIGSWIDYENLLTPTLYPEELEILPILDSRLSDIYKGVVEKVLKAEKLDTKNLVLITQFLEGKYPTELELFEIQIDGGDILLYKDLIKKLIYFVGNNGKRIVAVFPIRLLNKMEETSIANIFLECSWVDSVAWNRVD